MILDAGFGAEELAAGEQIARQATTQVDRVAQVRKVKGIPWPKRFNPNGTFYVLRAVLRVGQAIGVCNAATS